MPDAVDQPGQFGNTTTCTPRDDPGATVTNRARPLVALLLLLAGARLAIWCSDVTHSSALYHGTPTFLLIVLLVSAAAGAIAASPAGAAFARAAKRGAAARALSVLCDPSPAARRAMTVAIWLLAALYLAWTAHRQGRELFPLLHDENSYALGARMLARGRLWMPQHPLADFFDSFHILVRPVYASIYFPGTALLNVPAVWLGLPTWVIPVAAVVLFRYASGASPHDEPVYNTGVAWPDDAPVVRAHDLGPRNREVVQYFARLQPGRRFYRYDRVGGLLTPLGTAAELAAQPDPAPPATRPVE